jgi:hypothetical protein
VRTISPSAVLDLFYRAEMRAESAVVDEHVGAGIGCVHLRISIKVQVVVLGVVLP